MKDPAVLLVSDDDGLRAQLGEWLDGAGIDLMSCPGPAVGPCIALRDGHCALEAAADVVILDLHLDEVPDDGKSPYWALADRYLARHSAVMVISDDAATAPMVAPGVAVCPRILPRAEFLAAFNALRPSPPSMYSGCD